MFFQVYMFELFDPSARRGHGFWFFNVSEAHLQERFVGPWNRGAPITYDGKTVDSSRSQIHVYRTSARIAEEVDYNERERIAQAGGEDVTNEWITGPAGQASVVAQSGTSAVDDQLRDAKKVMVVHGRNDKARAAMFIFLRALGLSPVEWEEAVGETGMGSPHNLETVRAAMKLGQAVIVLLTAEDQAGLLPDLASDNDDDVKLCGQPRQNVILEAGMAMAVDPAHTILVELGSIRGASDFSGLNAVRLTNDITRRSALRSRLISAECAIDQAASGWQTSTDGGDFDGAIISWTPTLPGADSG